MSEADRERWNSRYRNGAYAERHHPAEWLLYCLKAIGPAAETPLTCLDLACGTGRNARYLASAGHDVYAIDIAGEALATGESLARQAGLDIHWIEHDLDAGLPSGLPLFDLILVIRYLDLEGLNGTAARLRPGGHLLVDVHLATERGDVAGPRNPAFRAPPGALRQRALDAGLEVLTCREEVTLDPDGETVALARLLARRPD